MKTIWFLIQVNIEEKLKNAPDNSYAIGILIGELIPFAALIGFGYFLYYRAKKNSKK